MLINSDLRREVTPQRVYILLKLVNHGKYTKEELKDFVQPKALFKEGDSLAEFNRVYNFVKSTNFINEDNGIVTLNKAVIRRIDLESIESFRKLISRIMFNGNKENAFFEFTSWYMSKDHQILNYRSLESLIKNESRFEHLNADNFSHLWRFWVGFIGLGFEHNRVFIPNPYLRILDLLEYNLPYNLEEQVPMANFMNWLLSNAPELKEGIQGQNLSWSLSFGLRTLHDQRKIKLINQQDYQDIWHLQSLSTHEIEQHVTHVIYKGGSQ